MAYKVSFVFPPKHYGEMAEIKPMHVEPRIEEVQGLIANAAKVKEVLKWEPKFEVNETLERYVDRYQNYDFEQRMKLK